MSKDSFIIANLLDIAVCKLIEITPAWQMSFWVFGLITREHRNWVDVLFDIQFFMAWDRDLVDVHGQELFNVFPVFNVPFELIILIIELSCFLLLTTAWFENRLDWKLTCFDFLDQIFVVLPLVFSFGWLQKAAVSLAHAIIHLVHTHDLSFDPVTNVRKWIPQILGHVTHLVLESSWLLISSNQLNVVELLWQFILWLLR